MDVLRDIPEDKSDLLMLGHNPGLEDLILSLVSDDGTSRLRDEVEVKFPTASLAVIEIDVEKWNDVGPQTAKLACFIRRRDLGSEEHTSELQSLMSISYAVLYLNKKK